MTHHSSRVARFSLAFVAASTFVWTAAAFGSTSAPSAASAPSRLHHGLAASTASDATGADLVARIAAQLGRLTSVRAQFRQTQTLSALAAPLVSTGTLVFVRDQGVIWRTEAPRRATVVIEDTGVTVIDAAGNRATRGTGKGGVAQVSKMIRAMLGGDLSALYSQFDVAAEGTPSRWRLLLTPNQPQLAQALKSLRMEGGAFLTMLEIVSANGDTTRIDFSGSQRIDTLPPADLALFGAH